MNESTELFKMMSEIKQDVGETRAKIDQIDKRLERVENKLDEAPCKAHEATIEEVKSNQRFQKRLLVILIAAALGVGGAAGVGANELSKDTVVVENQK